MVEVPGVATIANEIRARIRQIEKQLKQYRDLSDELERLRGALERLEGGVRSRVPGLRSSPPSAAARARKPASKPATPRRAAGAKKPRRASSPAARGQTRAKILTAITDVFAAVAEAGVPITSLVIGEGGSGGALALASHDNLWITPDAYFSVIAPEAATAILKQDPADVPAVATQQRLRPQDLVELGVVRGIAT
jgi:hypothetical protein